MIIPKNRPVVPEAMADFIGKLSKNVANWMSENGISSLPYYSGITSEEFPDTNDYRLFLEEQLSSNKISRVLVAKETPLISSISDLVTG